MTRFNDIANRVFESFVPSEKVQREIAQRYLDMYNIKIK
jgi:hypothetical protein